MNFGAILAGGVGSRVKNSAIPKQYIEINGIPIIIHTTIKLLAVEDFDVIIIATNPDWKPYLEDILNRYKLDMSKITIIDAGKERIDTIDNTINHICDNYHISDDDIVVLHDGARPYVSVELLQRSIDETKKYGATVAGVKAIDTMLQVNDINDMMVADMPRRELLYHGQAPDSFKVKLIKQSLDSLSDEERIQNTGTAQICMVKGVPIQIIEGEYSNTKITTDSDIEIAKELLKGV